jgi:hypothetical protein
MVRIAGTPRALVVVLATVALALAAAPSSTAGRAAALAPVPSLEPRATAVLWKQLTERSVFRPLQVQADCRPLRSVFYAATDWIRLATRLAARSSACANYSISVPPAVADKTRPRPDQAWRIRALGPSFHALAEIHLTAWQKWVASTGAGWYQAGVEARRRMAAAGYDVAAGDSWALNELSSAVRRGDGTWRTNMRDFLRGLFDAGGEGPPARGVVFVVGIGQRVPEVATYKARMQEWLQDAAFWIDMSTYVSDWSQEVYGDLRGYAAAGAPPDGRRDALVDYLHHSDLLAAAGGAASGTANAFFQNASSPLANAAWQWDSGFGWTLAPNDLMRHFVSAQVYALRNQGVRSGRTEDHWGFAWAPRNASSFVPADFTLQSGEVLDRLAAAIRDSATDNPADPGSRACGPDGRYTWCGGDLDGAALTDNWRAFRAWSPTTLGFPSAPTAVAAGAVSQPIPLQVQVAGVAARPTQPVVATVTSSSPTGTLATTAAGPFAPSVTVELAAGTFATIPLYYQDTVAGPVAISAQASGIVTGTHQLTVTGAAAESLRLDPSTATVLPGGTVKLTALGVDRFGNETPTRVTWAVAPGSAGAIAPAVGATATLTAPTTPGPVQVDATITTAVGVLTAQATITVLQPPQLRVAAVRYGVARKQLHVYVTVVDGNGARLRNASVTVALYRDGKVYARAAGLTTAGRMTFARPASIGTYRTKVTRVVAPGYVWNRATPANVFRKALRRTR